MSERGKYIVIEGGDGLGKTEQAKRLQKHLLGVGINATYLHEPGGTKIGEEIERRVKDLSRPRTPQQNLEDFTTARIASYDEVIAPTIADGGWIVADRNWLSTVAYQGNAEKLGMSAVRDYTFERLPEEYLFPALTILARASEAHRNILLKNRGTSPLDYFEQKNASFQQDILEGYEKLDENYVKFERKAGNQTIRSALYLPFDGTEEDVEARVWTTVEKNLLRAA